MLGALCLKFLFFIGALLSFADPVTDGLTCWKYFEAGEILWFVLCIVFIALPSIIYLIFWVFILPTNEDTRSGRVASKLRCCLVAMCCPFIPCCGRLYVAFTTKKHEDHDLYIEVFNCLEVGIELAPQFILQFYAAMSQSREVNVIQIVSLTITFLRIGWCYANINEDCTFRLCFGGLVSVAARVFAYSLFAVALGAWVVLVIVLHMLLTCLIQRSHKVRAFGYVCLSWLSYTPLGTDKETETEQMKWTSRTFIQPILHVAEDIMMALFYYFFVESSRTYPHRLKIMLGLIGGSLFGYIVLRLTKFARCRAGESERTTQLDVEACQGLNKQEVAKPNQGTEPKDGTDGGGSKILAGFSNWRARWRDPPADGQSEVKKAEKSKTGGGDESDGKFGRARFLEWKFRKGKAKDEAEIESAGPSQGGAARERDDTGREGTSKGFVGFRKIRNFKLRRDGRQDDVKS